MDRMEVPDGDGHVVENAISKSAIRKGVMGSAGEIAGQSLFDCRPHCGDGAASLAARSGQQSFARRQSEPHQTFTTQRSGANVGEIAGRVNPQELDGGSQLHNGDSSRRAFLAYHALNAPKLVHRKRMSFRQWTRVARVIKTAHERQEPDHRNGDVQRSRPISRPGQPLSETFNPALVPRYRKTGGDLLSVLAWERPPPRAGRDPSCRRRAHW